MCRRVGQSKSRLSELMEHAAQSPRHQNWWRKHQYLAQKMTVNLQDIFLRIISTLPLTATLSFFTLGFFIWFGIDSNFENNWT